MSTSAETARTGSCATCTSSTTASPVTTCVMAQTLPAGRPPDSPYADRVDVDAFVLAHRGTWDRLDRLIGDRRHLPAAGDDEPVELYQRSATHPSTPRPATGDAR